MCVVRAKRIVLPTLAEGIGTVEMQSMLEGR